MNQINKMYKFDYLRCVTTQQYHIKKIENDKTISYYFDFTRENYKEDKNIETKWEYTIEWSSTEWFNSERCNTIEYRAVGVPFDNYNKIYQLLHHEQYDELFVELNKLENVRVIRHKM